MDENVIQNLCNRTDSKLRYAEIYISELRQLPANSEDIHIAHQESFLFHLWGMKDAFLIELNYYYNVDLPIEKVKNRSLKKVLKKLNKTSTELDELIALEEDNNSWLSIIKDMRDSSTHRKPIPRAYHLGGKFDNHIFLRNQLTGENIERHFVDEFALWSSNMKNLIQRLRESALAKNN